MSLSRRDRYALAASVACLVLLVVAFAWLSRPLFPPEWNAYVGQTREQVIRQWGQPDDEWDGFYGNPKMWLYLESRYGPSRTMTFDRWRGSLYVCVHEVDGQWVCFSSQWFPRGVIIE